MIATLIGVSVLVVIGSVFFWTIREVNRVDASMTILQSRIERAYGFDLVPDNETGIYSVPRRPFGLFK